MPQALQDLMSRNFVTVQKADELPRPKDLDSYVVVLDAEGTPAALTAGDDVALGFSPGALFLVDEGGSIAHLRLLRPVLESEGFSTLGVGVMRGPSIVGIIPFSMLHDDRTLESSSQAPANLQYRCRRYPRCSEQAPIPFMHVPPLCPAFSAHGHMVLTG